MILRSSHLLWFFFQGKTSSETTRRCGTTMIVPRNPWNCHLPGDTTRGVGCQSRGDFSSKEVDWMDQGLVGSVVFFWHIYIYINMDVSENSGFSPQIIHYNKIFNFFNHPFWGTPIFGNTHIPHLLSSLGSFRLIKIFGGDQTPIKTYPGDSALVTFLGWRLKQNKPFKWLVGKVTSNLMINRSRLET